MDLLHRLGALAASCLLLSLLSASAHATSVSGQGTWESTLQGRDLDGNLLTFEAYYDTTLDITWLADANYAGATMTWTNANTWAAGLDPYGSGITGWRLPDTIDVGNNGCSHPNGYHQGVDCGYNITTHSEMSHMFYVTLGDTAFCNTGGDCPVPGHGLSNTGPFFNVLPGSYWSAPEVASNTSVAWLFHFGLGAQDFNYKDVLYPAWAVHAGDVGAVPVPAAVWLFTSGLLGLIGLGKQRRR